MSEFPPNLVQSKLEVKFECNQVAANWKIIVEKYEYESLSLINGKCFFGFPFHPMNNVEKQSSANEFQSADASV